MSCHQHADFVQSSKKYYIMEQLLESAREHGWGTVHPQPIEGFALLKNYYPPIIIPRKDASFSHPAIEFLTAQPEAVGETAFFSLEPCSNILEGDGGLLELLLRAGVKEVVLSSLHPNPIHEGKGVELFKSAGLAVETGIFEEKEKDLNLIHHFYQKTGKCLFAGKVATTIDGKIATREGHSRWITGEQARENVMSWRRLFPAIAVGAGTVIADNPLLTSRQDDDHWSPIRLVFDTQGKTLSQPFPQLYQDGFSERTILATGPDLLPSAKEFLEDLVIQHWVFDLDEEGKVPAEAVRERCLKEGIYGVYFEGGSTLLSRMLLQGSINYLFSYRAPVLFADNSALPVFDGARPKKIKDAIKLHSVQHQILGEDQLLRGFVHYPEASEA